MHNPRFLSQLILQPFSTRLKKRFSFGKAGQSWLTVSSMLAGLLVGSVGAGQAQAATPDTAPTDLVETLEQIEAAANQGDLNTVMQFYNRDFSSSEGLTYASLESTLESLWEQYSNLQYDTELTAWEAVDGAIVAETITTITGVQQIGNRAFDLTSTISSRQRFENGKIVEQETLSEQSQLTSGENPPTVGVNLPEQVDIAREFNFDAIVQEPLGDRLLLGAAVEETVNASQYLNPNEVEFELLSSGGLFKVGRAPVIPGDVWISSVLIREDGITVNTRRLEVTGR